MVKDSKQRDAPERIEVCERCGLAQPEYGKLMGEDVMAKDPIVDGVRRVRQAQAASAFSM
jgi:hypothetical protein